MSSAQVELRGLPIFDFEHEDFTLDQPQNQQRVSNNTRVSEQSPGAPPADDGTVSPGFVHRSRANSHLSVSIVSVGNNVKYSSSFQDPPTPNPQDGGPADSGQGVEGISDISGRDIIIWPTKGRAVHRKLRGIHIAMIAVNATLGSGLYWRGGQVLELGGPLSIILAFLLPGLLSIAVMQCITEMMCIWPIPGALSAYVSEFVDAELGIAVGLLYWFTYAASFAALVATCAAEMHYWRVAGVAFDGVVLYFLIPLVLLLFNCFSVIIYGWLEVITGLVKLALLVAVIVIMIFVNVQDDSPKGFQYWSNPIDYDTDSADSWANAFIMCISIAAFAYVGVEVVAASALEARWPSAKRDSGEQGQQSLITRPVVSKTVKLASIFIPFIMTGAYVIAGLLTSLNISRSDSQLPRLSWSKKGQEDSENSSGMSSGVTMSVFVIIARGANVPMLDQVINIFLVFTVMGCASTNLYVASRTLFGMTTRLNDSPTQSLLLRFLALFGKTNRFRVPMRAVIFSAVAFCWVPFLQLEYHSHNISTFIEILSTMASDSVIIVWAFECLAFIRFYHGLEKHKKYLRRQRVSRADRRGEDYPYRSPFQPALAYLALAGCIFVLIVANSALLWKGFYLTPFLSSFLLQIAFVIICLALKFRSDSWSMVDLSDPKTMEDRLNKLNDICQQLYDTNDDSQRTRR